jgi:hypothetical protein
VRTYGSLTIKGENIGSDLLGDPQNLENENECSKSHENRLKCDKSEKSEIQENATGNN